MLLDVTFHDPPGCTVAFRVCAPTTTTTADPVAALLLPAIVGVASVVDWVAPPVIVSVGMTALIVNDCVLLPTLPAASETLAATTRTTLLMWAAVTVHAPPEVVDVERL